MNVLLFGNYKSLSLGVNIVCGELEPGKVSFVNVQHNGLEYTH